MNQDRWARRAGVDAVYGVLSDNASLLNAVVMQAGKYHLLYTHLATLADWQKTEAQKRREQLLLDELVILVNKRDALVRDLDAQEKQAEEEDEHLERTLEQNKGKMAKKEEKCVLQ
ncbi:EH domain-binding protein 1 isoform X1 [Lates japonicus]|uniref:EH domain-binding protein 1 isoform X1 n=1 Tax=Lates japonicus TaxID=270547 RepID=A0AAD3NCM7_LATJO|nr:EH domain-binding protein 1 isoform X1 [Lates japonicus]